MKCLIWDMPNSAERRPRKAFAFNSDLRITLKVVVKFLARMPMPIKLAVWRNFNSIHQHFTPRSEVFA